MSLTTNYGWTKPDPGASIDIWGDELNADLDAIDSIIHGIATGGTGGGIGDAPNDGSAYARKSAAWANLTHNDLTDWATATASFAYSLPTASTTTLGGVKVDGTTITIAAGVISAAGGGGAAPSSTTPIMDGTAAIGVGTTYARADHVHPTDTTRYAASNPSGYQTAAQVTAALPVVTTTTPVMDGTAAIGASGKWADGAHVHPTDTTRAPLASPSLTGTPLSTTPAVNDSTTKIATTAYVQGQASSITPNMSGAGAVGTGTTWARADHQHPSDTSRAPVASPTFTGTVTIPTGANIATPNITGVTTVSNASAGQIGEVISSNVTTGVALTTSLNVYNITSISLTAGDWDVSGEVWLLAGAGAPTAVKAAIGPTSATLPAASALNTSYACFFATLTASANAVLALRPCRVNVSSPTTYYLIASMGFPSGSPTATGSIIARRVR